MVLAFVLFVNFDRIEKAQQDVATSRVVAKDVLRIEEGFKQYLILMDLVLGNEQTYLAAGSQRQVEFLQSIIDNISKKNLSAATLNNLTHFATALQHSAKVLPVIQAGSLPPPTQLVLFDQQTVQAITILSEITEEISFLTNQFSIKLDKQRDQNQLISFTALIIFLIVIVIQWLWISLYLAKPVQKLNYAVIESKNNDMPFSVNAKVGPLEIQELTGNVSKLINDLEEHIKQRTELYRLERNKAMAATEAKTKFLSAMSHELRTPLNGIMGFSQILEQEQLTDDQLDSVSMIYSSSQSLDVLISSIFAFIDVEDEKNDLSLTTVNITGLVKAVTDTFQQSSEGKNIQLNLNIDSQSQPILIQADERQLLTIYKAIISNSVKYSSHDSQVEIDLYIKDEKAVFSVTDHGVGMTSNTLKTIFIPFHQSQANHVDGLSISLYMAKYFTELMGGEIEVESVIGAGSSFKVRFPIFITH